MAGLSVGADVGTGFASRARSRFRVASERLSEAAAVVSERGAAARDASSVDWLREIGVTIVAGDALVQCGILDLSDVEAVLVARVGAASGVLEHAVPRIADARALLDAGVLRCAAPPIGIKKYDESLRPARGTAAAAMERAAVLVVDWLAVRLMARAMMQRAAVASHSSFGGSAGLPADAVGTRILKRFRLGQMSLDPDVAVAAADAMIQEGRVARATARGRRAKANRLRSRVEAKRVGVGGVVRRAVVDNGPELPDLLDTARD